MKETFGVLAGILTFALYWPYIRSIGRGQTRPHVFSWVIWGAGTLIVSLAQFADGGGAGAAVMGVSGVIACYIAALAYRKADDRVATASDRAFLALALGALPLWLFTSNPLWAVGVLTLVDLLGFVPTVRKAYSQPHLESVTFFGFSFVRYLLSLLALDNYSLTTILFPAAVGVACLGLALFLIFRKRVLALSG